MCGFFNVWICVCVGFVMRRCFGKCVLVFTVFLYCFVYVYLFFFMLLFNSVSYVFLLLCVFCSVYSVFIVPTGTLRLP